MQLLTMPASEIIALLQPPKPKPKWTPERDNLALSLLKRGLTQEKAAKKLRVSRGALSKRVWRLKQIKRKRNSLSRAFWTQERVSKLIANWNSGKSASVIAYDFGGGWRPGCAEEQDPTRCAIIGKVRRLRKRGFVLRGSA